MLVLILYEHLTEDNMSATSPGSTGDLGGDVNASSTLPRLRLLWLGRGSVSTSSKPRFLSSEVWDGIGTVVRVSEQPF